MSKNNGEPAFPVFPETATGHAAAFRGMTLRDYFAAKAMQGMVSVQYGSRRTEVWAKDAYELADAMLKAREVGNENNNAN